MRLYELAFACYRYGDFTKFDERYKSYFGEKGFNVDMENEGNWIKCLEWLTTFGCRQFKKNCHGQAARELKLWYEKNKDLLPPLGKSLLDLSESELDDAENAFRSLKSVQACERGRASSPVKIGPTGAAKILFTLRIEAFPPWDDAIRKELKYDGSPKSYRKFLEDAKGQLRQIGAECEQYGITLSELPQKLGRSSSSLVKFIDDYNWITMTRKWPTPTVDQLEEWYKWAKQT